MPEDQPGNAILGDITTALKASREGGASDWDHLFKLVYQDLRRLAGIQGRNSPDVVTLERTGLVNEAFLRLVKYSNVDWQSRDHFFAVASKAMRQIVVDECRRRLAEKRGGGAVHVDINDVDAEAERQAEAVLAINEELDALRASDPDLARVVECRFFAGYSEEETAAAMGVSLRTVQRKWKQARELLKERLQPDFG